MNRAVEQQQRQARYLIECGFSPSKTHEAKSFMKSDTTVGQCLFIQGREGVWFASKVVRNPSVHNVWRSGPFPDPISCYVNAELMQWKD